MKTVRNRNDLSSLTFLFHTHPLASRPCGVFRTPGTRLEPGRLDFTKVAHQLLLEDLKVSRSSTMHAHSHVRWPQLFTPEEAQTTRRETRNLWILLESETPADPLERMSNAQMTPSNGLVKKDRPTYQENLACV